MLAMRSFSAAAAGSSGGVSCFCVDVVGVCPEPAANRPLEAKTRTCGMISGHLPARGPASAQRRFAPSQQQQTHNHRDLPPPAHPSIHHTSRLHVPWHAIWSCSSGPPVQQILSCNPGTSCFFVVVTRPSLLLGVATCAALVHVLPAGRWQDCCPCCLGCWCVGSQRVRLHQRQGGHRQPASASAGAFFMTLCVYVSGHDWWLHKS